MFDATFFKSCSGLFSEWYSQPEIKRVDSTWSRGIRGLLIPERPQAFRPSLVGYRWWSLEGKGMYLRPLNIIDDVSEFLKVHAEKLSSLRGRRLEKVWFVWSEEYGEWWPDGPVVLDFEGERLEFQGIKLMVSLTWNTPGLLESLEAPFEWRASIPEHSLERVLGRTLEEIQLLVVEGDRVRGLYLRMDNGDVLQLFDDGDQTGLSLAVEPVLWITSRVVITP